MRSKWSKQDQKNFRNQTKRKEKIRFKHSEQEETKWMKENFYFLETAIRQLYGNFCVLSIVAILMTSRFLSVSVSMLADFYFTVAHWHHSIEHDLNGRLLSVFVRNTWLRSQFWYSHNFCDACWKRQGKIWMVFDEIEYGTGNGKCPSFTNTNWSNDPPTVQFIGYTEAKRRETNIWWKW